MGGQLRVFSTSLMMVIVMMTHRLLHGQTNPSDLETATRLHVVKLMFKRIIVIIAIIVRKMSIIIAKLHLLSSSIFPWSSRMVTSPFI